MNGLTAGRMVHYVCAMGHCAAVVTGILDAPLGRCTLFVMPPGEPAFTRTAFYDPNAAGGTWHWIERA